MNIIESTAQLSTSSLPASFWIVLWVGIGFLVAAIIACIVAHYTENGIVAIASLVLIVFTFAAVVIFAQSVKLSEKYDEFMKVYYEQFKEKTENNNPIFYSDIDEEMIKYFDFPGNVNTNKPIEVGLYLPQSNKSVDFIGEIKNVDLKEWNSNGN